MKIEQANKLINKHENEDIPKINSQLDKNVFKENLKDFNRYGDITLPSDLYNNIDFKIYRDLDGIIRHNANLDKYFESGVNIYLNSLTGSDNNNGRTIELPIKSLAKAIELCELATEQTFIINIVNEVLARSHSLSIATYTNLTKNYKIKAYDKRVYLGGLELGLSFTKEGNCYKATRSAVETVFDKSVFNFDGTPTEYKKVNTLSECNDTKGTWFTDGTSIYIRRLNDSVIDSDILIPLNVGATLFKMLNDTKLMFENICFTSRHTSNPSFSIKNTSNVGHLIMKNCSVLGSSDGNGIEAYNVKHSWLFDCISKNSFRDGFNYHNTIDGKNSFVFEYNCVAYDNGLRSPNGNNNATTAHDGINILRINSKGWNTKGPVLADIQGCYSINYDCTMYDCALLGGDTATAFFFSNDGVAQKGKHYLINCSGGGYKTYAINTYDDAIINVKNFVGQNFPKPEIIKFIS